MGYVLIWGWRVVQDVLAPNYDILKCGDGTFFWIDTLKDVLYSIFIEAIFIWLYYHTLWVINKNMGNIKMWPQKF